MRWVMLVVLVFAELQRRNRFKLVMSAMMMCRACATALQHLQKLQLVRVSDGHQLYEALRSVALISANAQHASCAEQFDVARALDQVAANLLAT